MTKKSEKKKTLESRVEKLEKDLEQLKKDLLSKRNTQSNDNKNKKDKGIDTLKKLDNTTSNKKETEKIPPKAEAYINSSLKAVLKQDENIVIDLDERQIIENELVYGDAVILESDKNQNIKEVKVAQRTKRSYEEGLVTEKDGVFYAVSKFTTHRLLDLDVKSKGILKGFEVILRLPQNKEVEAEVVLIKEVESSSNITENEEIKTNNNDKPKSEEKEKSDDLRVLSDDDLV